MPDPRSVDAEPVRGPRALSIHDPVRPPASESGAARRLQRSSYSRLHLARNPFGEIPRDERAALAQVDVGHLADHLRAPDRALQFVADHGRGKSTHLIALHARHFPDATYVQLRENARSLDARPSAEHPLFLDSIENLGRRARRRVLRDHRRIAFTTHVDLEHEARAAGLDVLTVRVGIDSLEALESIVRARVAAAARGTGRPPSTPRSRIAELYGQYGDDVRSIEGALYDDVERLRRSGA